jgi:hypothetical protein
MNNKLYDSEFHDGYYGYFDVLTKIMNEQGVNKMIEVQDYYKHKAKDLTDMLFDKGFLAEDLSRKSIDWLEDYLGFILQSEYQMAEKGVLLSKSIRDNNVLKD